MRRTAYKITFVNNKSDISCKNMERRYFKFIKRKSTVIKNSRCSKLLSKIHCVKNIRIRSYSGPHFPAFGLSIFSRNAGKYGSEQE